jgi:hypothetical protein
LTRTYGVPETLRDVTYPEYRGCGICYTTFYKDSTASAIFSICDISEVMYSGTNENVGLTLGIRFEANASFLTLEVFFSDRYLLYKQMYFDGLIEPYGHKRK